MSPTIEITEFESLTDPHLIQLLDKEQRQWRGVQLAALQQTTQRAVVECDPFERDESRKWRATRWVGAFGLGDHRWVIKPRIGQDRFNLLARCVLTAAIVRGGNQAITAKAGALDLLPLAWYVSLQNALGRSGLPKARIR